MANSKAYAALRLNFGRRSNGPRNPYLVITSNKHGRGTYNTLSTKLLGYWLCYRWQAKLWLNQSFGFARITPSTENFGWYATFRFFNPLLLAFFTIKFIVVTPDVTSTCCITTGQESLVNRFDVWILPGSWVRLSPHCITRQATDLHSSHQRPSFVSRTPPFLVNVTFTRWLKTCRRSFVMSFLLIQRSGISARWRSFKPSFYIGGEDFVSFANRRDWLLTFSASGSDSQPSAAPP